MGEQGSVSSMKHRIAYFTEIWMWNMHALSVIWPLKLQKWWNMIPAMHQGEQDNKLHYIKSNPQPDNYLYSFCYTWLDRFIRFPTFTVTLLKNVMPKYEMVRNNGEQDGPIAVWCFVAKKKRQTHHMIQNTISEILFQSTDSDLLTWINMMTSNLFQNAEDTLEGCKSMLHLQKYSEWLNVLAKNCFLFYMQWCALKVCLLYKRLE